MYRRPLDAASFRPKWLQTSFRSFRVTRNGHKPLFGRFGRPEMAANLFLVTSGDPKWPQTSFWSFQATRNGRKPLFGRFGRKDAIPNLLRIFSKDRLRGGEGRRFIANRSSLRIAASPAGRVGAYRIRPFRRPAGPNTDIGVCPFRDIRRAYAIRPYRVTCIHPLRVPDNYPLPSTLYPLRFTTRTPCRTSMCPAPSSSARSLRGRCRRRRPAGRCNGRCA